MTGARYCQPEIVEFLVKARADPNANAEGSTPLAFAARSGSLKVVEMLLKAGADVSLKPLLSETVTVVGSNLNLNPESPIGNSNLKFEM
jgi:ankyrin repeat protein